MTKHDHRRCVPWSAVLLLLLTLATVSALPGITVSEVRGFGRTRGRSADAAADEPVQYVKKSMVEVVIPDALVERVVRTIQGHAHTGNVGEGKIFLYSVDDVMRIRTGEQGDAAI